MIAIDVSSAQVEAKGGFNFVRSASGADVDDAVDYLEKAALSGWVIDAEESLTLAFDGGAARQVVRRDPVVGPRALGRGVMRPPGASGALGRAPTG